MSQPPNGDGALHVSIDLWYPDCWEIEITDRFDVGLLGYGIYATGDDVSTLFTMYAREVAVIEAALEAIRASPHVHSVSEMQPTIRQETVPRPGNALREILVGHDGREQISQSLTSRGFVCTGPIDIRDGREYWTLVTNHDRETVQEKLESVRVENDAEIDLRSMQSGARRTPASGLPVDRLTQRQREVFQLARERGYYEHPKETTAQELADELGISTSTLHEHLHKVESILLG